MILASKFILLFALIALTLMSIIVSFSQAQRFSDSTQNTGSESSSGSINYGLIGYWPLNEGSGSIAYNEIGSGNNGLLSGTILEDWSNGLNGWTSTGCSNNGGSVINNVVSNPQYLNFSDTLDIHNAGGTTLGCSSKQFKFDTGDVIGIEETGDFLSSEDTIACFWNGTACDDHLRFVSSFGNWYDWIMTILNGGSYTLMLYNHGKSSASAGTDQYFSVLVKNMPLRIPGKFGNALEFTGSQYVRMSVRFANLTSITISAWAYFSSTTSTFQFALDSAGPELYTLGIDSNDTFYGSCSSLEIKTNVTVSLNNWHMLTETCQHNGDYNAYIDGREIANGTMGSYSIHSPSGIEIGSAANGQDYYMDGRIEEVRIYNYALNSSQISALYFYNIPAKEIIVTNNPSICGNYCVAIDITVIGTEIFVGSTLVWSYSTLDSYSDTISLMKKERKKIGPHLVAYLRRNWGAIPIIASIVLLDSSAMELLAGVPSYASNVVTYALSLLAVGALLQIRSYRKY